MAFHRVVNHHAKRIGHHARVVGRRVGSAVDKALGCMHHLASHVDEKVVGALVGENAGKVVHHGKRALASYEDLRTHIMGKRE